MPADGLAVQREARWRGALLAFKRRTEAVLFSMIAAMLLGMVITIGLQVFYRYVMNDSLAWSDEVARLLLVWMTFVGGGLASFRGVHLRLDMIATRFGTAGRRAFAVIVTALVLVFLAVLFIGNLEVIEVREGIPFTSFALSSKYLSYAIGVGAVLMAVGSVVSLVLSLAADGEAEA